MLTHEQVERLRAGTRQARLADSEPRIRLVPHPEAPRLSGPDGSKYLVEALERLGAGTLGTSDEARGLLREASLTSLFFFLKMVAGYSGPYDKLSWELHVDLCNFRQMAIEPGIKAAAFVPRSSFKSTVMTHGASAWELIRNPNLRIGIFSSKYERAAEFMHSTQRVFDENDLVGWLFPEWVPSGDYGSRWNDREAVLPCRSRSYPEPNLKAHSAGGSTAGVHVDLALFDDIIDDSQLNADHAATADLYRMKNWLFTNMRTLLVGQESRVVLSATRYAIDDPYETIMHDAVVKDGYWGDLDAEYPTREDGEWAVYYRRALEDGTSIFPEAYTAASLERLASSDPWTYQTQYLNDPKSASVLEFLGLKPKPFTIEYDESAGDFILELGFGQAGSPEQIRLADCDVVVGVDPAASERRVSQRTSKTGIVLIARDWKDRIFIIEAIAGYWAPSDYIDRVFGLCERYRYRQSRVVVEMQAGFKVLGDVFREEQNRRGIWLGVESVNALVHKEDTIRGVWEPALRAGRIYTNEDACTGLLTELSLFPSSPAKDLLDAGKIAIAASRVPEDPGYVDGVDPEITRARAERRRLLNRHKYDRITGY